MKIDTDYDLGQKVYITELENCPAVIHGISIDPQGTTYFVHWFHNGKRESGYLFPDEIEPR